MRSMNKNSQEDSRQCVIQVATQILNGSINPVAGCRMLLSLEASAALTHLSGYEVIRAIESETDDYPIGEPREGYDASLLTRLDTEIEVYLGKVRGPLLAACRQLLDYLHGKTGTA